MWITKEQCTMVREFLVKKKMTQIELAKLISIRPQQVTNILACKAPWPKRVYTDLVNVLPLNKKEFKKDNFVFKKGAL